VGLAGAIGEGGRRRGRLLRRDRRLSPHPGRQRPPPGVAGVPLPDAPAPAPRGGRRPGRSSLAATHPRPMGGEQYEHHALGERDGLYTPASDGEYEMQRQKTGPPEITVSYSATASFRQELPTISQEERAEVDRVHRYGRIYRVQQGAPRRNRYRHKPGGRCPGGEEIADNSHVGRRCHRPRPYSGAEGRFPVGASDNPCVVLPRLRFGAVESDPQMVYNGTGILGNSTAGAVRPADPAALDTLRFRHHAARGAARPKKYRKYDPNSFGKPLVDLSRVPVESFEKLPLGPHSPIPQCKDFGLNGSYRTSLLRVHHYLGSRERYFGRKGDTRRNDEKFDRDATLSEGEDDDIRPWFQSFVKKAGNVRAKELLTEG